MKRAVHVAGSFFIAVFVFLALAPRVDAHGPAFNPNRNNVVSTPAGAPSGAPNGAPQGGAAPGGRSTPGGGLPPSRGGITGGGRGAAPGRGPAPRGAPGGVTGGYAKKRTAGGAGRVVTKWGKKSHAPSIYYLLDYHWIDADWPMARGEGYVPSPLPLAALISQKCYHRGCFVMNCKGHDHEKCHTVGCLRDKKPAMVYIYDPAMPRKKKYEIEHRMLGDDNLAALSNFVHCFHMAADEVELEQYRKNFGTKLPALVFLSPTGETIAVLQGEKIRTDQVRNAFKKVFWNCFQDSASANLKIFKQLTAEMEKSEDQIANKAVEVQRLEWRSQDAEGDTAIRAKYKAAKAQLDRLVAHRVATETKLVRLINKDIVVKKAPSKVKTAKVAAGR